MTFPMTCIPLDILLSMGPIQIISSLYIYPKPVPFSSPHFSLHPNATKLPPSSDIYHFMGSCFSTHSEPLAQATAKVITLNGSLQEYFGDIRVSEVLKSETNQPCFLCNSDQLYYDEFIQALNPEEQLQMGQIYFVLLSHRLKSRLTAPDMAALAVKASSAIAKTSNRGSRKSKKMRISPVIDVSQKYSEERFGDGMKRFDGKQTLSRSGSVRRLQRNASKRANLAIRSFRFKLSNHS